MKWTPGLWMAMTLAVAPACTAAAAENAGQQAMHSLSDIMTSEEDVPALLGIVPAPSAEAPAERGDKQRPVAPAHALAAHDDGERAQLLARLKAQQLRTSQLTGTIASLNARLKTLVPASALAASKQALDDSQLQLNKVQDALTAAQEKQEKLEKKEKQEQQEQQEQHSAPSGPDLTPALNKAQADLKSSEAAALTLRGELEGVKKDNDLLTGTLKAQTAQLDAAQASLADLKKPAAPASHDDVRDYAVGTSLGADVLSLLKERAAGGVSVGHEMALAGIRDAFAGRLALTQAQIDAALTASAAQLAALADKEKVRHEQSGSQYMARFAAQTGVKKDPDGFLYRIDSPGEGDISEADAVSVVMKEQLTDGTVIKDMESGGKWVTQPVNAFPPVFRKSILRLKNHGAVTLVVPPNLAYGDQGYPPKVPPGATMVYTLRIHDVNGH